MDVKHFGLFNSMELILKENKMNNIIKEFKITFKLKCTFYVLDIYSYFYC